MSRSTTHRWAIAALALLVAGGANAGKSDTITATVVAVDAQSHTVTLESDDGKLRDVPVEGDALEDFDQLEPGGTINATFRVNQSGRREAITHLVVFRTVKVFEAK